MNNETTDNTTILKAVIYARFSSDMQREESIEAQVRACREYATKNRIEIIGEYVDRAKSATTDQRPEFLQMIDDSKEKTFQLVLVHKLDRFSRNRYDSTGYRKKLKRNDVQLVSVLENYDPDSPEGALLESMLEGMNEFYSRNLAREVEKGKRENALKGLHVGGTPPLGYDVDPETRLLVINEREAEAVRTIFSMYLDGFTYGEIFKVLDEGGYTTKRGLKFGKNSLYSILHNEKYTGVYIYSKSAPKDVDGKRNGSKYKSDDEIIRVDGVVPQLVTKEDFQRAQERLKRRSKAGAGHKARQTYLLSGKVFCGQCGSPYIGNSRKKRPDHPEYVSYRCNNRKKRPRCTGWEIRRESLESMVLGELANLVFNDSMIPKLADAYYDYMAGSNHSETQLQNRIKKEIASVQKDIDNLVNVIMKSGSDTLVAKLNEKEQELKTLKYQLIQSEKQCKVHQLSEEQLLESFQQAREMLKSGTLSTVKRLIERYIKKVIVNGDEIEVQFDLDAGGGTPHQPQNDEKKHRTHP